MSWPLWNQTPIVGSGTMDITAAAAAGYSGYTPEQWATLQQQNWQQWSQWQEQYTKWQLQYGEKYAEQLRNANVSFDSQPPLPSIVPSKPPPPPPDGPPPNKDKQQNANSTVPSYQMGYPMAYGGNYPYNQNMQPTPSMGQMNVSTNYTNMNTNMATQNRGMQNTTTDNSYYNNSNNQWNQRQGETNRNINNSNDRGNTSNAKAAKTEHDWNEEERLFDEQFRKWEDDFLEWKKQNANHPDKNAYNDYEQKFEACRAQLIERKEQMKARRAAANKQTIQNEEPHKNYQQDILKNVKDVSAKSSPYANSVVNEMSQSSFGDDQNTADLFPNIADRKGIPGLDLVESNTDKKVSDVIDLDNEEEEKSKVSDKPDLSAISKGINSILGDEKLLNLISTFRSNAKPSRWSNQDETSEASQMSQPSIPSLLNLQFPSNIKGNNTPPSSGSGNRGPMGDVAQARPYDDNNMSNMQGLNVNNLPNAQGSGMWNQRMGNTEGMQGPMRGGGNKGSMDAQYGYGMGDSGMGNMQNRGMGNMPNTGMGDSGMGNMQNRGMGNMPNTGMGDSVMGNMQNRGMGNMPNIGMADLGMGNMQGRGMGHIQGRGMGDMWNRDLGNMQDRGGVGNMQDRGMGNMQDRGMGNMHDRGMGNMQDRGMGNIQDRGMGNMQDRGMGNMQDRGMGNMQDRGMGNSQDRGMGNMQDRGVGNMQDRGMGNMQDRGMGNMQDRGMGNMQDRGMGNMQDRGMGNMQDRGINNRLGDISNMPMRDDLNMQQNFRGNNDMFMNRNSSKPNAPFYEQFQGELDEGDDSNSRNDSRSKSSKPDDSMWKDIPLIEPITIVDYQHQPRKMPSDFFEPSQIFDYNHVSKNNKVSKNPIDARLLELDSYHSKVGTKIIEYDSKPVVEKRSSPKREPSVEFVSASYADHRSRDEKYDRMRRGDRYERSRSDRDRDYSRSDRDRDRDRDRNRDFRDEWDDRGRDDRYMDRGRWYDEREGRMERSSSHNNPMERNMGRPKAGNFESEMYDSNSNSMDMDRGPQGRNIVMIDDLLESPGREMRPERIVIIMRGLPGSGKSYIAKLIKEKEQENGGNSLRILSIDDYFMTEVDKEVMNPDTGRKETVKEMKYEYDKSMEGMYVTSLIKSFKKTVSDGFFSFIILDAINNEFTQLSDMATFAKQKGFATYFCEVEEDVQTCHKRNIHERTLQDIEDLHSKWYKLPPSWSILDTTTLLQSAAIDDVHMEDVCDEDLPEVGEDAGEEEVQLTPFSSKWDKMDDMDIAKLDGTSKPLRHTASMEDYLQLDEWTEKTSAKPGKKTVRWADIEERREQEKMRAIGFVVGQTNWDRMTDPTQGSGALTKTKYIERVRRN